MKIMKKISLFIFALVSMFAFTFGVSALDVNDEASLREALSKGGDVKLQHLQKELSLIKM